MSVPSYPDVGDLAIATVKRVVDYGAYVRLDEYEGLEGLIHISEISTTWVKNIRYHVREGQKLVLKVLRVDRERRQVDLSLRRVTGREKTDKMLEWKRGKKADSIIKGASERLKADQEMTEKIRVLLYEKLENPYEAFQEAVEEGEEVFTKLGVPTDWAAALAEVSKSKVKLEKASLTATIELTCEGPEGVEAIRAALSGVKKVKKPKGASIRVYAIGAPRYRIEATTREYSEAEALLNSAVDEATNTLKSFGGEGRRVS
ncbi:translation initiation factor IF-2 subunit alpha [[Eubacterium] cellulosolvens]